MNLRNYIDQLRFQVNQMRDSNVAKWLITYLVVKNVIIIYNYQYSMNQLNKNYKNYSKNIN